MNVIDRNLLDSERVLLRTRHHKAILFIQPVALLISAAVVAVALQGMYSDAAIAGGICLALISFGGCLARYLAFEAVLTSHRALTKLGIVSTKLNEIVYAKMEAIDVDQNLLGRLLGYGSLEVTGTGGSKNTIAFVPDPFGFRKRLQHELQGAQAPQARSRAAA